MSDKESLARDKLARLCQALADDVDKLTDEELLAESTENGDDVEAIAERVGELISDAIAEVGGRKLAAARAGYEARTLRPSAKVLQWSLEKKRELMFRFAESDHAVKKKLTLAARNGEETEADVDSFIEDLLELGAIDDEGNVT